MGRDRLAARFQMLLFTSSTSFNSLVEVPALADRDSATILAGAIHSPVGCEVASLGGEYIRPALDQLRGQAGGHGVSQRG